MKAVMLTDTQINFLREATKSHTLYNKGHVDEEQEEELRRIHSALDSANVPQERPGWLTRAEARVLDTPPNRWDELATSLDVQELAELDQGLSSICHLISRAAAYFGARAIGGDHRTAVKKSNKVTTSVRKALGYTYPKSDLNF